MSKNSSKMTITDLVKEKEKLQAKITIAIEEFKSRCDFYPDGIDIYFVETEEIGERPVKHLGLVKIRLEL